MTSLSTHVLDTAEGRPVAGVTVTLERSLDGGWQYVGQGETDGDGRVAALGVALDSGVYRLVFATGDAGNPFYPEVHVIVDLDGDEGHYHVPLLLSPYGYTTYRGS
ncbi:MAG: hydroxyisourate hydrolase [Acidimicrobiia bacterium]